MARTTSGSRPGRSLTALVVLIASIYGLIAAGVIWSDAQWTPKLALDLEGGTQIILKPILTEGESGQITPENLAEAVNIIRQRVDGSGVAEAEVTTQGDQNIVVSIPGKNPDQDTIELVQAAAQLQFRAVLVAEATGITVTPTATGSPTPSPSGSASVSPSASPAATPSPSATTSPGQTVKPAPTQSGNGKNIPAWAVRPQAATTTPTPTPTPSATGATPTPSGTATPNGSDPSWVTPEVQAEFAAETCTDLTKFQGTTPDPTKPLVTCSDDGTEKYILGPAEVLGTNISGASAVIGTNDQGFSTGQWEVNLEFDSTGTEQFRDVTSRLAGLTGDTNRFAIVLDGVVISAPTTNERIPNGQARISGNFTQETAQRLASQLKFGALPISFRTETIEQISALLGAEQLRNGLIAGLLGLILVVVYSLFQYRALGFVTVASLLVVGVITYGLIVLLGWRQGYRLSLPGVAGLIVSIGVTADSFIVYFERIRDEVRDGKSLPVAVEQAWVRARRTIIVSDAVSFLAAVVLYTLAVGGVRGFAFTLGLTTIVDLIVVFLFTKPMVTLLSRTHFFASGHKLSGFDAVHLGRNVAYAGRGRTRTKAASRGDSTRSDSTRGGDAFADGARPRSARSGSGATIAERRAAAAAAAASGAATAESVPQDTQPDDTSDEESVSGSSRGGRGDA